MATIGILLSVLLVAYIVRLIYAKSCLKNLDIQISISAPTAVEGDILMLTEVLTNNKWLPLPWVSVKFETGKALLFTTGTAASDAYYRNDLFHILMHQKITRRLSFTCTKRGRYTFHGLTLTAWDILMSQKYIQKFDTVAYLTVYPSTLPSWEIDNICTRVHGQLKSTLPIITDPFAFRGIREYSEADSMKAINFKASAKGQGLMVNQWDFIGTRHVHILLDTKRQTLWYDQEKEERAIKIAASISEKMTRLGVPVSFTHNSAYMPEGYGVIHHISILEALTDVEFSIDAVPLLMPSDLAPEYWLVTPEHTKETAEAYQKLKATGAKAIWLTGGEQ